MTEKSPLKSVPMGGAGGEIPIETAVANHSFLAGLKEAHQRILRANAMRVEYAPGELIFRQGDPANRFYLLEEGSISLEAPPKGGPPKRLQTIGAGEVLGWSWLFPPHYWRFDARVLEPTKAVFIYGTPLREACEEDHDLGYELMKRTSAVVIDRLQCARRQILESQG